MTEAVAQARATDEHTAPAGTRRSPSYGTVQERSIGLHIDFTLQWLKHFRIAKYMAQLEVL